MDRDQLSPQLGRLIDEAKAAAAGAARGSERVEGVALLLDDGAVVTAPRPEDAAGLSPGAAALAAARRNGEVEIEAAAVAWVNDAAQTLGPSPPTQRDLTRIDSELPLVLKERGRWVTAPLSELPSLGARLQVSRVCRPVRDLLLTLEAYDLQAFGANGLRRYDLAVMTEAGAVYLARMDSEIVAGCQLLRVLDEPDLFYVVGFYVRPEWQGLGLGKAFLALVAREAEGLGAGGLILTVSPDNQRALRLYEGAGFVNERFAPDFYGEGEDRYILRWRFARGGLQGSV